jgi:hypothetical protein
MTSFPLRPQALYTASSAVRELVQEVDDTLCCQRATKGGLGVQGM